mmetsp:Transcript_48190/g.95510  ORF Transcript_48190/g.95510 Transcript_48190/m.95510 type:complete len:403 (-) Transcript_48190:1150-2358(-)
MQQAKGRSSDNGTMLHARSFRSRKRLVVPRQAHRPVVVHRKRVAFGLALGVAAQGFRGGLATRLRVWRRDVVKVRKGVFHRVFHKQKLEPAQVDPRRVQLQAQIHALTLKLGDLDGLGVVATLQSFDAVVAGVSARGAVDAQHFSQLLLHLGEQASCSAAGHQEPAEAVHLHVPDLQLVEQRDRGLERTQRSVHGQELHLHVVVERGAGQTVLQERRCVEAALVPSLRVLFKVREADKVAKRVRGQQHEFVPVLHLSLPPRCALVHVESGSVEAEEANHFGGERGFPRGRVEKAKALAAADVLVELGYPLLRVACGTFASEPCVRVVGFGRQGRNELTAGLAKLQGGEVRLEVQETARLARKALHILAHQRRALAFLPRFAFLSLRDPQGRQRAPCRLPPTF